MTHATRLRRPLTALFTALSLLLPAAAGNADAPGAAEGRVVVDPNLLTQAAAGAAPAILAWDKTVTTREQVTAYLRERRIPHHTFSALSMAVACAGGSRDVHTMAGAPGVVSVWGDELLVPALEPGAVASAARGGSAHTATTVAGVTGDGVGIAVLDTGIDATHPDLEFGRKTLANARAVVSHMEIMGPGNDNCVPDTFEEDTPDSETVSGHGTHLAGVAAGDGNASGGQIQGVAPGADLMGVNIIEQTTPQVTGDISVSLIRFLAGVNYVMLKGLEGNPLYAKVALLGWTSEGLYDPWHPHALGIRDLHDFGISVVVPVGNGGSSTPSNCSAAATCRLNPMAVGSYAIGVGATRTTADGAVLADYSSAGDPELRQAREDQVRYEPTVVAPGTDILGARRVGLATFGVSGPSPYQLAGSGSGAGSGDTVTDLGYQTMTGTSVAAAHVAGTIALMQQAARDAKGCYLTADQVRDIITGTARPMNGYQRWQVGAGLVDQQPAVAGAVEAARIPSADPWMCPPEGT